MFTTGGIGPTHDDITADCVAKAFGVPIDYDPRAVAIMKERYAALGTEMNEARMRMTRVPKGADLVPNRVSAAPGFWIGNVIVMAGVPSIMQAMLDEVAPKLATGARMLSETVRADCREGDIGTELGEIAKAHPEVIDRQLSLRRRGARPEHQYRGAGSRSRTSRGGQGGGGSHADAGARPSRKSLSGDGAAG